jgi:hypothetical protein
LYFGGYVALMTKSDQSDGAETAAQRDAGSAYRESSETAAATSTREILQVDGTIQPRSLFESSLAISCSLPILHFPPRRHEPLLPHSTCCPAIVAFLVRYRGSLGVVLLLWGIAAEGLIDPMLLSSLIFRLCSMPLITAVLVWLALSFTDRRALWLVLMRWDAIYPCLNLIAMAVTLVWVSSVQPTANRALLMSGAALGGLMGTTVFTSFLAGDAVCRSLVSRRTRQLEQIGVLLLCLSGWLSFSFFQDEDEWGELCFLVCLPATRLFASLCFNLAVFTGKFCVATQLWPRQAVTVKGRIHLEP